ncbi:MAG: hypothetical protein CSA72_06150 [Rhodobacterales bacterium]|nr:MAG: hypothetical protein CSA72_06150 [Rhodobacterales bacterium]
MDSAMMIQLLAVALGAGAAGGILAGLMGVGGGIVIVPALYFALGLTGMEPGLTMQLAVGTSLATIVFTALSSASGHYRRGAIDMALLRRWAPWILIGVVLGSLAGGIVSGVVLMAVFTVVALLVGLDMVLRRPSETSTPRDFAPPVWAGLGMGAGAISAMMGIGGGTVCVPVLSFLGYDIRRAVGTSAAIGFLIGLPGAVVYAATGFGVEGLPPFSLGFVNLLAAAVIIPMTTLFARVGVRIAHAIPRSALRRAFGLFLLLTAVRMGRDLLGILAQA